MLTIGNLLAFQCKFNVYFLLLPKLEWDGDGDETQKFQCSKDANEREITSGLLPFAWSLSKS